MFTSYRAFEKHLNSTSYKDIDGRDLLEDTFRKEIPAQITLLQNIIQEIINHNI